MTTAYLALGSNLGDRPAALQGAVDGLAAAAGVSVTGVSRVYETEPVGGPDQPAYLNAVVVVETSLDARALLGLARDLERRAGREPDPDERVLWGPRELDVDVLLVGTEEVDEADLVVPHPRMAERPFVLAPLADVAPDHPAVATGLMAFPSGWPGVRVADVELAVEER